MPLKLPAHILELNPHLPEAVKKGKGRVGHSRAREDQKHVFIAYWRILAPDGPEPETEYRFAKRRKWQFDWAWPMKNGGGLAVEVDGGQHMEGGGRHGQDGDREKLNRAAADYGWTVLRYSPRMLKKNPDRCVAQVRKALKRIQEIDSLRGQGAQDDQG